MDNLNRRQFLQQMINTGIATGSLGGVAGLFQSANASELLTIQPRAMLNDYKALVCIDLKGGNDGFNTIIPTGSGTNTDSYELYKKARGGVFKEKVNDLGLALAESDMLSLSTPVGQANVGIHSSMPEIQQLFNAKKASVVANVGALIRPTNKQDYKSGISLPQHLFSHSDQQILWFTPRADETSRVGWAGLLSDKFLNVNNQELSMNISASGENVLQASPTSTPFFVGRNGAVTVDFASDENGECAIDAYRQCATFHNQLKRPYSHPLRQAYAKVFAQSMRRNNVVASALSSKPITDIQFKPFWDTFGLAANKNNFAKLPLIAQRLFVIARLIAVQEELGMSRQVFYAKMDGYDTHDDLIKTHKVLLTTLSKSLGAFQLVLEEINKSKSVTTFTTSEFGRTTSSNGDGSDHGWGSHHFVIGGDVDGGKVFGNLPNLSPEIDNPDNADWGQIIPSLSTEQYAATLCRWLGAKSGDINSIFPNLRYMTGNKLAISGGNLGFMG